MTTDYAFQDFCTDSVLIRMTLGGLVFSLSRIATCTHRPQGVIIVIKYLLLLLLLLL